MRWKIFLASAILGSIVFQVLSANAAQPEALAVPFSTQFDGSRFAATDCGPASVAMAINYATGSHLTPIQARQELMRLPGGGYASNPDSGTAIGDLARVAKAHQVETFMGDGQGSTGWGTERIRHHLSQGHPVIVLTRLAYLPGYNATSTVDHYIILTGTNGSGYVYNDPAMANGAKRSISEKQLQLAQRASSVPGQGAAFAGREPEQVAASLETQAEDESVTHITVVRGDTLSRLAERYGVALQQLIALNRSTVRNPDHIEVGQVLVVPVEAQPTS